MTSSVNYPRVFVCSHPNKYGLTTGVSQLQGTKPGCSDSGDVLADSSDVSFLVQEKSLDGSFDLADVKKAADKCVSLCRAGGQGGRRDAVEELERKVMELNEHQRKVQEQMAHKHNGKNHVWCRGKRKLQTELFSQLNVNIPDIK